MTENENIIEEANEIAKGRMYATKALIECQKELEQYRAIGTVEKIMEMQFATEREHDEVLKYRAIGTIEEFKALKEYKAKMEMQYLDDINNPLEPLKLNSACIDEIMKGSETE